MTLATACPKPAKREKSPRKPMKRSRIAAKKRNASDFARIYGSKARVRWIKEQDCWWCGRAATEEMPSDNAHTVNGGKSRKADFYTILPLCRAHHRAYDKYEPPFHSATLRRIAFQAAAQVESQWQRVKHVLAGESVGLPSTEPE
ncbi:MAG TPA: hypothetical protein VGQ44_17485 [Gemmatimonadaceae bacterium]|nr:hypothetical protein [Gemmatimonadaceae bacterium]